MFSQLARQSLFLWLLKAFIGAFIGCNVLAPDRLKPTLQIAKTFFKLRHLFLKLRRSAWNVPFSFWC